MIKTQVALEIKLIKDGARMKDLSFTRIDGYDVTIYRKDNITSIFIFGDGPNTVITMTKKTAEKDQSKIDEINSNNKNIHAYYEDDKIVLTMECLNKDAVKLYKIGRSLLNVF